MNHKCMIVLILTAAMLCCVLLGCGGKDAAVEEVRQQLSELPTVEEFQTMEAEAQLEAYNRTQKTYDAYMALTEQQKQQLPEAQKIFEDLFAYFNGQIMPLN